MACAHEKPLIKTEIIYVHPPSNFLSPTEIPRFTGSSCADVILHIPELKGAIRRCNADKESIRQYSEEDLNEERE